MKAFGWLLLISGVLVVGVGVLAFVGGGFGFLAATMWAPNKTGVWRVMVIGVIIGTTGAVLAVRSWRKLKEVNGHPDVLSVALFLISLVLLGYSYFLIYIE